MKERSVIAAILSAHRLGMHKVYHTVRGTGRGKGKFAGTEM